MIKNTLFTICTMSLCAQSMCFAANYPTKYQIFGAGYQKSMPLQEKLARKQGEFFHKKSGLYFGAAEPQKEDEALVEYGSENKEQYKLDAYAGLKQQVGIFGYHLGFKSYNRVLAPETLNKDIEVQEVYVGGNIKAFHLSYASNDEGEYTQLNFKHDVSNLTVGFHLGKTKPLLGEEFTDWSLYASKSINSMKLNAIMTQSEDPNNSDMQINFGVERELSLF